MSKNNKANKTEQNNSTTIKADVQAVARTEAEQSINKSVILKDYTQEDLQNNTNVSVLQDYLSFKKDFVSQIAAVYPEFENKSLSEVVSYALKQTFNIENLTSEMLERSFHNRQNATDRINNVVRVKKTKETTIKADATATLLNNLVELLSKQIIDKQYTREIATEKLEAYLKDNSKKEEIKSLVLLKCFSF